MFLLKTLRLKLIDDWHQAWRWSSMRFLTVGGAIQLALQTAPGSVTQYVPQWVLQAAGTVSFVCIVCAGIGRVTKLETKDEPPHVP